MTTPPLLQITSNELGASFFNSFAEIAELREFDVTMGEAVTFNAPFSGEEYFRREIQLLPKPDSRKHLDMEKYLLTIEALVERELSEAYVDYLE